MSKNPAKLWDIVDEQPDPVAVLQRLGARWSPALTRPGPLRITARDCVICRAVRPGQDCNCADIEFGSDEYFARLDQVHGRTRR